MNSAATFSFRRLLGWFKLESTEPDLQLRRIRAMERDVGLPVKGAVLAVLVYFLYFSRWFEYLSTTREVLLGPIRILFVPYFLLNCATGFLFLGADRAPIKLVQWGVMVLGVADGLLLAALCVVTGGFDSLLFWLFPFLIARVAISVPMPGPQLVVSLLVTTCYLWSGLLDISIGQMEAEFYEAAEVAALPGRAQGLEPFLLRLAVLVLCSLWCYAIEVLWERQRRGEAEAREFVLRQQQLEATGRLAAEIAHQLKNPLGIINNAAFSLQRALGEDRSGLARQVQIIREEVSRSDGILTDLMGYARLAEGRVEKLEIEDALEEALAQVFPSGTQHGVRIDRDYGDALPSLLMQKGHLMEVLVNILQNARQAMQDQGRIWIRTRYGDGYAVRVHIRDNGPGIAPEMLAKVFEPYFTTKTQGTGLGLAIVKHNTEIYGGAVRVDSELGKGTEFTLDFPARTSVRLRL